MRVYVLSVYMRVYACVRVRVRVRVYALPLVSLSLHTSNLTGIVDALRTKERKGRRNEALRKIHSQNSYSESL